MPLGLLLGIITWSSVVAAGAADSIAPAPSVGATATPAVATAVPRLLSPRQVDSKTYSESFTVIGYAKDGTYVQGALMITNIGLGSGQTACQMLVAHPGKPAKARAKSFDRADWATAPAGDASQTLRAGSCRLTISGDSLVFHGQVEGTLLMISLRKAPRPAVPPGHPVRDGKDFYESEIWVPFAPVTITLAEGSSTAQSKEGFGYADHSRSTMLPAKLSHGWVRFRGFGDGCHRLFLARFHGGDAPAGQASVYTMGPKDDAPLPLAGAQLILPSGEADKVALHIGGTGNTAGWDIAGQRRILRQAPLEEHGFLGRMVGSLVGAVVTEVYDATFDDHAACRSVRGVLEIDHIN